MDSIITVVSGLPRSGTTMMMRMLEAGGMEVIVDNIRKGDEDNPNGYYEFEKAKQIKEDTSWLESTKGKVFKMVSMLLYNLPADLNYKVVFMKRNMKEILASQKKMLKRKGKDNGEVRDEEMGVLFNKHLSDIEKWLEEQTNIDVLYVNYNDVIENPESVQTVNSFFDNRLDTGRMINVVDKALYRNKADKL